MVKRGSLNKVEKFYIEGNIDMSVEDLATELDRSVSIIQKYIGTLPKTTPTKVQQEAKSADTRFLQNMGRHERAGQKVATVMTKSASEIADEQRPARTANKKIQEAIHKPRS